MASGDRRLYERQGELQVLSSAFDGLGDGHGAVVLLEGHAGIGKTALLGELRELAVRRGARVLRARAGELEQDDPFAVLRQLFGPPLSGRDLESLPVSARAALGLDEGESPPPGEDAARSARHALWALCRRLAASAPLVVLLDDGQWADEQSLRWLVFLARRTGSAAVMLVVAHRPREPGGEGGLIEHLATAPGTSIASPEPLSLRASAELLGDRLGTDPAPGFCAACQELTGGNPFLLVQLVAELQAAGITPEEDHTPLVLALAPESVARATLLRLARAPQGAPALARALAVLEEGELREAALLAGLDEETALRAATALGRAGLLAPLPRLRFAHPLVRAAIYADIDERERAVDHRAAAGVLLAAGASPERVAAHLLLAPAAGEPAAVRALQTAAQRAYAGGAPATAIRCLQRALEERPAREERAALLTELGRAGVRSASPEAVGHLEEARRLTEPGPRRARVERELARGHIACGRMDAAVEVFENAVVSAGADRELALALEGELAATLANVSSAPEAARRLAAHRGLDGRTPAERSVLALLAFAAVQQNEPAAIGVELMGRALDSGDFVTEQTAGTIVFADALFVLILCDQRERAKQCLTAAERDAERLGWSVALTAVPFFQGWLHLRLGDLESAERCARLSLARSDDRGWQPWTPMAAAVLCEALVETGRLEEARALLESAGLAGEIPDSALFQLALLARARLNGACGEADTALDELRLCGERELALGGVTAAAMCWRSEAALMHARRGQMDEARRLVAEELELARAFGVPRGIGIALRASGLLGEDADALAEAVDVLAGAGAEVELARALVDLGAALRRSNRRRDSRAPLREGLAIASACGAAPLAERARAELLASGARPRRAALSGPDALTPSERRVADLAASGMSNREIAEQLVVTVRTVEFHLSRAYAKLDISSRRELAARLAREVGYGAG